MDTRRTFLLLRHVCAAAPFVCSSQHHKVTGPRGSRHRDRDARAQGRLRDNSRNGLAGRGTLRFFNDDDKKEATKQRTSCCPRHCDGFGPRLPFYTVSFRSCTLHARNDLMATETTLP